MMAFAMMVAVTLTRSAVFPHSNGCTSVEPKDCGTKYSNSCLQCNTTSPEYNCLKCCTGCKRVQYSPTKAYCECSPKPVPGVDVVNGNMSFAGKTRNWISLVPENRPPAGLIVVLNPETVSSLPYTCIKYSSVAASTGAILACPAALLHDNVKGGGQGACWKAWGNYGTCGTLKEDSEDVNFLAALIQQLIKAYDIPTDKVIMSGMSNGGSMAFRFNCERADLITGLAIQSQAYFDPYVGFYDYSRGVVPSGTPVCKPSKKVPFYSDIGDVDVYYGPNVETPGFRGIEKWRNNYSIAVLGCTGEATVTSRGPHKYPDATGPAVCYQYASCPGIIGSGVNRFCSVPGMGHDDSGFLGLLPAAFADFF